MSILAIDVGGHHVKILLQGMEERREFLSGPSMTAEEMIEGVERLAEGWSYDVVSLGYPGPVLRGRPLSEPKNLGRGWVGFDFEEAFGRPVKVINDAAMQALGSYQGGRMLFLGLGTGLGSAMIVDGVVEPMELAHLPYRKATFEDYVGQRGLKRLGKGRWRKRVADVVAILSAALEPTDIVIGGGNAKKLKQFPPGCRAGDNDNAFVGGFRLWDDRGPVRSSTIPTHGGLGREKVGLQEDGPGGEGDGRATPEEAGASADPAGVVAGDRAGSQADRPWSGDGGGSED